MKLKNNIILGYLALSSCLIFGQKLKIKAFENNLTQPRDLIFEDSLVAKYSIYERMKYYKIPSSFPEGNDVNPLYLPQHFLLFAPTLFC